MVIGGLGVCHSRVAALASYIFAVKWEKEGGSEEWSMDLLARYLMKEMCL